MNAARALVDEAEVPEIPVQDLVDHFRDGTMAVVDVLPRDSYREGHIASALSLPLDELPERAAEVLPDRSQDIVVYCGSYT